ncbi:MULTISPECIES: pLS20_p028 family conjugation system transmembrane protein [Listeria]|uniref:DUF8208 domain-containing protein n=1 Tax=Listeria monocytogenes TaxID=1639 RepID=A0A823L750_LISMN|nr:hypothetical protein [Listeria monocytogenes]EIR7350689.1 hypothetical protein [Listeria innocua]EAC3508723.1 hypothetical protein [Listeria monocytogenes]EAC3699282.1 hypothetical protein [Listeria monocytogenes]EAC3708806.1 hypothetical protein [Listeria monocytogenes]EAC4122205.1 hypothetical protein [Listeria monocytogenes]
MKGVWYAIQIWLGTYGVYFYGVDGEKRAEDILQRYGNYFVECDLFNLLPRILSWLIIKVLVFFNEIFENVLTKIFDYMDFFKSPEVKSMVEKFILPISWGLLALAIVIVAFQIIVFGKRDFDKLVINIIVGCILMIGMPTLMGYINDLGVVGAKGILNYGNKEKISMAKSIVNQNVTDILWLDQKRLLDKKQSTWSRKNNLNGVNQKDIMDINIAETVDYDTDGFWNSFKDMWGPSSDEHEMKKLFQYKLTKGTDGQNVLVKFENHLLVDERWFRYSYDFWGTAIPIFMSTLAMIFSCFKIASNIFQGGFIYMMGTVVSAVDISTGQRTKKIIEYVVSLAAQVVAVCATFKLYIIFTGWVVSKDMSLGLEIILLVASGLAVIDGMDIFQRVMGLDAGVKDGQGMAMGLVAAASVGKNAVGAAKQGTELAKQGGRFVFGTKKPETPKTGSSDNGPGGNGPEGITGDDSPQNPTLNPSANQDISKMRRQGGIIGRNGLVPRTVAKAASVAGGVTGATVGITKGMEPKSTIKPDLTPPNPVNTIANENNQQPDIDNPTIRFSDDNGSGEQATSDPRTVQEENAEGPVAAENKTESTPKDTKNNLSAQSKRTVVATSGNAVNTSTSKGQKRTAISPQENRNNITSSKPNTAQSDVKNGNRTVNDPSKPAESNKSSNQSMTSETATQSAQGSSETVNVQEKQIQHQRVEETVDRLVNKNIQTEVQKEVTSTSNERQQETYQQIVKDKIINKKNQMANRVKNSGPVRNYTKHQKLAENSTKALREKINNRKEDK